MQEYITIYLIRHARQNSPLCNVNVELAEEGIIQSRLLGQRLKHYEIDRVYSSHLTRAAMTADIVRDELGMKCDKEEVGVCIIEDLQETDFGELTGLSDEVLKVKYAAYFAARDMLCEDLRIPGGENGQEVYLRMSRAMNHIIENALEKRSSAVAVVSHGGAIRCYLAGILGMPWSHRFMIAKNMENTAIMELRFHIANQVISVERLNDYAHLEGHEELLRKHFK